MVPRPLDRSGVEAQGDAGGEQKLTRTQGGVSQKQQGGCPIPPFHLSLSLFVFSSYDRPTRTAPAERDVTGATPPFVPLARHGEGWVSGTVSGTVSDPLPAFGGGRSRLYVSLPEGSPARTRAGRRAATSGAMLDRLIRAFLRRRRRQCRVRLDVARRVFRGRSRGGARPLPHPERVSRRRRVVLRRARRGRVPRRALAHQHIADPVRPDGRPCGAPVPPSGVAAFAFGRRAGDRRRRGPSPGQSHREPGSRMADDPGARPLYGRGDFRRGRVRQDVGVYAPVRAPVLELARDESRAARRRACP